MTFILEPTQNSSFVSKNEVFKKIQMVRIGTINDSSSLFHAIFSAFHKPYIMGRIGIMPYSKKEFVKQIRKELAFKLTQKVNLFDENSPTFYEYLNDGDLAEIASKVPAASLETLKGILLSSSFIDYRLFEYIFDQLDKDIYMIDYNNGKLIEYPMESNLYYKGRQSIILLKINQHYELLGVDDKGSIKTLFEPTDEIILKIGKL